MAPYTSSEMRPRREWLQISSNSAESTISENSAVIFLSVLNPQNSKNSACSLAGREVSRGSECQLS
jgi:hypothetical protein